MDPTRVLKCLYIHIQLLTLTCCVDFGSFKMEIIIFLHRTVQKIRGSKVGKVPGTLHIQQV